MTGRRIRSAREMTIWAIHKGESNSEIAARIRKAHPNSPLVTAATVNYVRNELRKGDPSVKSDRALRKDR